MLLPSLASENRIWEIQRVEETKKKGQVGGSEATKEEKERRKQQGN
jgi:hypothetical protein